MTEEMAQMSPYERARWDELQTHWQRKAKRRELVPPRARAAIGSASQNAKGVATRAGRAVAEVTPVGVKSVAGIAVDAALVSTVQGVVQLLELLNDWVVELNDPKFVLDYHQKQGRVVTSIEDLRDLDLEVLEEFLHGMVMRWRTFGAGQGASFGALAMIPVPVLGSVAAISLDAIAMQVLSSAIATRVCYAYGFDASNPAIRHMIDRMVGRSYRGQAPKVGTVKSAGAAFQASKNRINWSAKMRKDHRLMAAVEKLLKQVGNGTVPIKNARMGMPVIAVFIGAGTNSHILGDIAKQSRHYAATTRLAEKYGLELPANLQRDLDVDNDDIGPSDDSTETPSIEEKESD